MEIRIVQDCRRFSFKRKLNVAIQRLYSNMTISIVKRKLNYQFPVIITRSIQDAITLVRDQQFRIVTDMVRAENGKLNYFAGIDLLNYLFQEIKYKNQVLAFCGDADKASFKIKKSSDHIKFNEILREYNEHNIQYQQFMKQLGLPILKQSFSNNSLLNKTVIKSLDIKQNDRRI